MTKILLKLLLLFLAFVGLTQAQQVTIVRFPGAIETIIKELDKHGACGTYASGSNGTFHGFVYSNGRYQSIDFPHSVETVLLDCRLGPHRVFAGVYTGQDIRLHAFLFQDGHWISYDFPGALFTEFTALGPKGEIAGDYLNSEGHEIAFVIHQ